MLFHIITIFPQIFDSYLGESIIKRALDKNLIQIKIHDLRKWTDDRHRTVDDKPYGGGPGMILKAEPILKALEEIKGGRKIHTVLFTAGGKKWNQAKALEYSKLDEVIMVCGRYEGVDARIGYAIDEQISIGNYVLTGGELAAMVIVDSASRLIEGVLGNEESIVEETHTWPGMVEYPQYTRPETLVIGGKKRKVPSVLLSGDHGKIKKWRENKSKKR